ATRTHKRVYRYEVSPDWHQEAAALLRQHIGPVIVAGYRSELYTAEYEAHGWQCVERRQMTNSGGAAVECLWLNQIAQTTATGRCVDN
ncbi:MAG: hypothetical protein KC546_20530, partial [Anaerolineae bacterium]|nr:hypothetical protein [Anaerolineae bacterium]